MVLAISGGVDSMLMLSMCTYAWETKEDVVVAHYNHKMRPSADDDARFVEYWANYYDVPFYYEEAKPGEIKSEDDARRKRYDFLRKVAAEVHGEIWTAHHVNDLVETMAINIIRGTGWRGLVPFSDKTIHRFFLEFTHSKREVLWLAENNDVTFRQDPTNEEDDYLRNRIRHKIALMDEYDFHVLYTKYYLTQKRLKARIDGTIRQLLPKDGRYKRAWFYDGGPLGGAKNEAVALEVLRAGLARAGVSATRPQIMDFLRAIQNYAPSKKFNLPGGKMVTLYKDYFVL